uniref:Cytochrome P450 n=2 Tax=Clastoptera arizonana TaxID=38151 RepID=A0A1B6CXI7_9HEMI
MKAVEDGNDEVKHERLRSLKYANRVVLETLRKYPIVYGTIRTCTKDYKVPGSDLVIEKGISVYIPIYSIHRDPAYYTDPEVFDPDRFHDLSVQEREVGTFIPFGEGPRFCIGSEFSILLVKLALVQILSKYSFSACSKTKVPVEFTTNSNYLSVKSGIWLKVEKLS